MDWIFDHVDKKRGYTKLQHDCIAVLKIIGEHNENRANVYDKRYAEHRCSKAQVLDIYHMLDKNKKATSEYSLYYNFKYTVGETVEVKDYDKYPENGIHYYLTEEAAFHDTFIKETDLARPILRVWCGEFKQWYEDGRLYISMMLLNAIHHGLYQKWHKNGNKHTTGNFINGTKNGLWEYWNEDGTLILRQIFINGIKIHSTSYYNGFVQSQVFYDEKGDELRVMDFNNGLLYKDRSYLDGELIEINHYDTAE